MEPNCENRAIGVEPEADCVDARFDMREALGPKADVMPLARAVIDRPPKADGLGYVRKGRER